MTGELCTLYISTCDKYSDLWESLFLQMKKHWPDMPYPVTLVSERKTFSMDVFDIKCPRFGYDGRAKPAWSELNQKGLETVDTPYVIFMLEDYFLTRHVKQDMIARCLDWMEADGNIGRFMLCPLWWDTKLTPSEKYAPFSAVRRGEPWRFNASAAVWRKEVLLRSITDQSNHIWAWENAGNRLSCEWPEEFYAIDMDHNGDAPLLYHIGGSLHVGRWTVHGAMQIRHNNLPIDISRRGVDYKHTVNWAAN